jgi:hypothetical protein
MFDESFISLFNQLSGTWLAMYSLLPKKPLTANQYRGVKPIQQTKLLY